MKSRVKVTQEPTEAIKKLEKLNKMLSTSKSVKVGLPKQSSPYPDGTSVIMVGMVHEFGSIARNIPERSFLRKNMKMHRRKYLSLIKKLAKKIVRKEVTFDVAMAALGQTVQDDVKKTLTELSAPALKNRVGNPLIDTGHLRQEITYKVEK